MLLHSCPVKKSWRHKVLVNDWINDYIGTVIMISSDYNEYCICISKYGVFVCSNRTAAETYP